jgi:two-component system phosphate regulon response regulator PhoB
MATILIVEDQPSVAEVVRYHLENSGFDALVTGDVESAWRLLIAEQPDAAVVDIKLPDVDGWTLLERIRGDARYADMPAVVLTGLPEPEVVERAGRLGCQYLSKPFAASALVGKMQLLLQEPQVDVQGNGSLTASSVDESAKIKMVTIRAVLLLDGYEVEGTVHLPPHLGRFSDAWEEVIADHREFLPITDAKITVEGRNAVAHAAFLQVRKSRVQGVFPKD